MAECEACAEGSCRMTEDEHAFVAFFTEELPAVEGRLYNPPPEGGGPDGV